MSDIKKVEFKKIQEKKTATEKKHLPAIRIAIPLTESTRKFCPIFSWPSLVRKRYKKSNSKTSSSVNGSEEINNGHIAAGTEEDEDAGDVKRLARHFELKYGGSSTGKKKRSMFYNYSELATGYDESDSFIDNSDAFDEELPDEMDTFYGGYYVNSGVLQFKKLADKKEPRVEDVSDDEDVVPVKKRTIANVGDSGDEEDDDNNDMDTDSDDNYDDEEEEIDNDNAEENNENSVSSSEDSTDDKSDDEQNVSTERSDNEISDKLSVRSESKLEQKQNVIEENDSSVNSPVVNVENNEENYSQQLTTITLPLNGEMKMKKSKKRHFSDNTIDLTFSKHKKKSLTVKSLLEEKRTQGTIDKVQEDAAIESDSNNLLNKYNLPNETVMFNAVKQKKSSENNESNNSIGNDSKCSIELSSSNVSITAVEKDSQQQQHLERLEVERNILAKSTNVMSDNKIIKLPDNLPSDVLRIIDEIITAASKHHVLDMGSRSFFSSSINEKLLNLEMKIRSNSSKTRQKLYHYLSLTVPCSKETLMKRAKKLIVDEEEKRMEEPCKKLTMAIASIMPMLIEKYTIECQQIAEQKDNSSDKKSQSSRMPQKKFTWNDETRSYLRELVLCRLRCFYIVKPRGESPEGYITKYLSSKLKPLWPQGWMRTSVLLRESHVNDLLLKIKKGTSSAFTSPNKSSTVPTIVDDDNNANLSATFNNALQRRNSSELQSQSAASSASSNKEQTALLYESVVSSAASGVARKHDLSITSNSPLIGPSPDISTSLGLYSMLASMSNPQYGFTHNATYATTTANFDMLTSAAISSAYSSSSNSAIVTSKRQSVSPICAAGFNQVIAGKRQQSVSPIQISSTPSVQRNQSISPVYSSASTGVQQPKKPSAQHSPISSSINHSAKPSSSVSPVYSHPSLPVLCQTLQTTSPSSRSSPSSVDKRETASPNDNLYKMDHLIAASTSSAVSTSSSCSASKVKAKDSVAQHLPKYRKQSAIANKTEAPSKPQPVPTHGEEVLDLSPNKIPKSVESHDDTQSPNEKIADRNYWPSGKKNEESYLVTPPEAKSDKLQYVQPFVVPKETTGSSVTHHLNRKQRLLQDSIVSSQSAREVQETTFPSFSVIKTDEKSGESDMRMIEETATATDVISQIINDTLQDNSTPLQPQFNRFNFENKYLKNEIIPVEEKYKNLNKTEKMKKEIYSSASSAYVAKERSREDSAIVAAAEVIKDLQMLNRIGRTISKSNFTDSSPIHSVVSNSSNNYNNPNVGSMHPDIRIPNCSNSSSAAAATAPYFQSSLRVSSSADNSSDIPRMSISGFQNEYFKHIFKSERNKDDVTSGSIKKHNEYAYNKKDRSQVENCRTDRSNHYPLANIPAAQNIPENSLYIPQQSVIVPTLNSSSQWRTTTDSNM